MEYLGIQIDPSRDNNFDEIGLNRLRDSYMSDNESSPQERFAFVSKAFSSNPEHAQRLYDYSSQFWFGYATPILSFGRNKSGLPISCYLSFTEDTKKGLVDNLSEANWLSMLGGGVGVYWNIRGQDEKSVGVIPHMKIYDDACLAYKQGTTRRGSYAMYLDISHPDIIEFLEMRKETGDQRRKCLNLNYAVNIPNSFMEIIERCMIDPKANDDWELRDPASGVLHDTVSAKELWEKIMELRAGQGRGEPYIHFIDNTNNQVHPHLREQGYQVKQSNLCVSGDTKIKIMVNSEILEIKIEELKDYDLYNTEVLVLSKNLESGNLEYRKIEAFAKTNPNAKVIKITDEKSGKSLVVTPDHIVYTSNRGEVKAKDLKEDDELIIN